MRQYIFSSARPEVADRTIKNGRPMVAPTSIVGTKNYSGRELLARYNGFVGIFDTGHRQSLYRRLRPCGVAAYHESALSKKEHKMDIIIKHFDDLSARELFEIYKLRVSVFVVEQKCPYQEVDDADKEAYHVMLRDEGGIQAYARVLPPGAYFEDAAIGRVIAVKRRCGLGSRVVSAAIDAAHEKFSAQRISLEAQVYAKSLYEKLGFVQTSEPFLEDGIPHMKMTLELS